MLIVNILFDLDGTLIDSKPGIVKAYEQAVAEVLPQVSIPDISDLIGPPMREMLRLSLKMEDAEVLDQLMVAFKAAYDSEAWKETIVYDGVSELLQALAVQNKQLFIVTNKRKLPTLKILDFYGLSKYFTEVVNPDSFELPFSNKSAALAYVLEKYKLQNKSSIFVGDAFEDAEAAANNNIYFVAATYGYGEERLKEILTEKTEISQPLDLLNFIPKS